MIIKNGLVFTQDKRFEKKDIYIEDGRFVSPNAYTEDMADVIDAEGQFVLPGLIDIHSHGAVGCDFSDGDKGGVKKILAYERAHGITTYCPTSMTLPQETLETAYASLDDPSFFHLANVRTDQPASGQNPVESGYARIAGINMEGPFLDPVKKGAHVEEWITEPDADFVKELNEVSGGRIRLVTLAPNVKGAMDFIREMKEEVQISLGHTAADYECAAEAMALGAHHVTHLYNAMQPLAHREPGLIGAASDDPECMVELICDGYHIHPAVIRATFRMFGPERVILISDSMRATGMKNGTYELGGQEVTVKDRKAVLKDGTLAGSATNLFGCMCKAIEFGVPVDQAIFAATRNPARSIGIYDRTGSVHTGKEADILLLTENFELKRVI